MEKPIKIIKLNNNHELRIYQDSDPISPRDYDNLGTMICWHSRYNLGDGKESEKYSETSELISFLAGFSPDEIETDKLSYEEAYKKVWKEANEKAIILPLRLFDHSGISMSIGSGAHSFDPAGWDSGQVGWIHITKDKIKEEFGETKSEEKIIEYLKDEVEIYDQYLRGDVYGFQIIKKVKFEKTPVGGGEITIIEENECMDSCWGFYGANWKENGIIDYIDKELLEGIEI